MNEFIICEKEFYVGNKSTDHDIKQLNLFYINTKKRRWGIMVELRGGKEGTGGIGRGKEKKLKKRKGVEERG